MGKRGPKPKGKTKIEWSANFAYAIGLIASDGCLYTNKKTINFTSKDSEQIENIKYCLGVECNIGLKSSGSNKDKKYFVIQIGDALFYDFLIKIGITPAKSKTIGKLEIPAPFFFDFLRGLFDGDGYSYSYFDPRWKSSFLIYTCFCSASKEFILWLQNEIFTRVNISGHITKGITASCYQLKYSKKESLLLLEKMYENQNGIFLSRKRLKIDQMLAIVGKLSNKAAIG